MLPGFVDTGLLSPAQTQELKDAMIPKIPMQRFARAEEIAGLVTFLCSPRASYITGAAYAVDGGYSVV